MQDSQYSLLEEKVDKIEKDIVQLMRLVQGDKELGVTGLRDYINANEEWKRNTEKLLTARDKHIEIDVKTAWFIIIVVILLAISLFFAVNYFTSNTVAYFRLGKIIYGFNNWLFPYLTLWIK